MQIAQIFLRRNVYIYHRNGENKADLKWQGRGIIIARFGRNGDLIYPRGISIDVDLNDLTPENKMPDVIDRGGTFHLHLTMGNATYAI